MNTLIYKQDCYDIIGACMEVHKELGKGFSEIIYGDALEIELTNSRIEYKREVKFNITYKRDLLSHFYLADFNIDSKIVLELKAIENLTKSLIKQTLNYLSASKIKLGILVNFGENSLTNKRVIL